MPSIQMWASPGWIYFKLLYNGKVESITVYSLAEYAKMYTTNNMSFLH